MISPSVDFRGRCTCSVNSLKLEQKKTPTLTGLIGEQLSHVRTSKSFPENTYKSTSFRHLKHLT